MKTGQGRYITSAEMDVMILMDALTGVAQDQLMPITAKMGKETARNFRHGTTLMKKALRLYGKELSADDLKKIAKRNASTTIMLRTVGAKPKEENRDSIEAVHTLAGFAIAHNCTGCTKDGETCELKHALAAANVPYTTTEPENCPYEQ